MAQTAIYSGTKIEGLYLGSYDGNAPSHHWFLAKTEQGEEVMSSNAFEKHAGLCFALGNVSMGSVPVVSVLRKPMCQQTCQQDSLTIGQHA